MGSNHTGCRRVPSPQRIMWQAHGKLWTAHAYTWPWGQQASHRRLGLVVRSRRNWRTHNAARTRTARLPRTSWPMTTASIAAGASTGARRSGGGRTGLRGSARAAETQRRATRRAPAAVRRTTIAIGTVGCGAGTANRSRVRTPRIGVAPLRGVGISRDSGKREHGPSCQPHPCPSRRYSHGPRDTPPALTAGPTGPAIQELLSRSANSRKVEAGSDRLDHACCDGDTRSHRLIKQTCRHINLLCCVLNK